MAKLYKFIGEKIINEMLITGISILLFFIGVNYFNLQYSWISALSELNAGGTVVSSGEISLMFAELSNTFPFNYFFNPSSNFTTAILTALIITIIGLVCKILITRTKEDLIEDFGHELMLPGIIGFFTLIALQVFMAVAMHGYSKINVNLNSITSNFQAGISIWNSFNSFFIIGVIALAFGSVILVIANARQFKKIALIGKTLVLSSYILLGYYLFIRFLGLDFVMHSNIGEILQYFIIVGKISNFIIIICVFMFAFGRELKKYGEYLKMRKKWLAKSHLHKRHENPVIIPPAPRA